MICTPMDYALVFTLGIAAGTVALGAFILWMNR